MANEIQVAVSLGATKGGASVAKDASGTITMSGEDMGAHTQVITTSATAMNMGTVTGAPAAVLVKNLDPTNYVEVDSANSFDKFPQKIRPGCGIILFPETATMYLKANTASCLVEIAMAEA